MTEEKHKSGENKHAILEHLNQVYWHQFGYHREKEYRIFIWTSAILIAGLAGLATSSVEDKALITQYGVAGKALSSIAVCIWVGLSIWMQLRERINGDKYAGVLVRISKQLHCFEPGFFDQTKSSALLPQAWQTWENEERPRISRLLYKNFIPVTFSLGVIVLLVLWTF